ncbi:MAG TPA: 6-phosphogluconolactonase [Solimonas sp.]|nr:6-phosphogluconolactonase [Solimonas sp.]
MDAPAALALPPSLAQHPAADVAASADALAAFIAGTLERALQTRSQASLLVSGGRSPVPLFAALSRHALDWPRVTIGLVDERCVPPDSDASNARLIREHLLQGRAASARFVPLYEAGLDPEAAAVHAERTLATMPTPFDAVVLGMGDDGHTASLFPDAPGTAAALDPRAPRRVVAICPASAPHARLSLTMRALLDSRVLALSIAGAGKCRVLEAAADADPARLPIAAFVQQKRVPLHAFFSR